MPSINLGNAENRTRGRWMQSESVIHCAYAPPGPFNLDVIGFSTECVRNQLRYLFESINPGGNKKVRSLPWSIDLKKDKTTRLIFLFHFESMSHVCVNRVFSANGAAVKKCGALIFFCFAFWSCFQLFVFRRNFTTKALKLNKTVLTRTTECIL